MKPARWAGLDHYEEMLLYDEVFWQALKNTLIFMSNARLLKEKNLKPPTSWSDLLDPAYKGQIQTADARTSGTALTRILSIYYAFGKDEGFVVDTHVARLSRRLGFTRQTDPVKIESDLNVLVPKGRRTLGAHLLIFHGRRICTARKPPPGPVPTEPPPGMPSAPIFPPV